MKKFLVMQTDFSFKSGAVSVMHGVAYNIDNDLIVDDLSHEVEKFNPFAASTNLAYAMPYWPKGTVFCSVVDPGVGTARKACIAKTKTGYYVVTPDNGALTHVKKQYGIEEVREIDEEKNRYPGTKGIEIFHGRDLFAYCGALLASGKITWEEVGPTYPVEDIVMIDTPETRVEVADGKVTGYIEVANKNFGINVTSISSSTMEQIGVNLGDTTHVTVTRNGKTYFDEDVVFAPSFGYVPLGAPVIYNAEGFMLGLALNCDDFIAKYNTSVGPDWVVTISKK